MTQTARSEPVLTWRLVATVVLTLLALAVAVLGSRAAAQDGSIGIEIRNHLTTGFPLVGAHQNIRCESCHVRGIFKNTPKTCEGCHTPSARIATVTITAGHVPTTQPCNVCHNQLSFAGAKFNHAGVAPASCQSCHNGTFAQGKPAGHVVTSSACDTCHRTTTWAGAGFDHAGVVAGTCANCHNGAVAAGKVPSHIPTTQPCDTCHTSTASFASWTMNHTGIATGCTACHSGQFVGVKTKASNHVPTSASCETCHTNTTSFALAAFNHAGISSGCAGCHGAGTAAGKPAIHIPTQAPCENCHRSTTAFSTLTMNHAGIATGCTTCHGGQFADVRTKPATHVPTSAACETCHTSTTSFTVASFNHAGIVSGCAICHDAKTAAGKPTIHIPTTAPCETCHKSTTAFSTLTMDHTGIATGCSACHGGQFADVRSQPSGTHVPTNAPCESCHKSTTAFSTWTMNHSGIATGCAACHGGKFADVRSKPATHIVTAAACETCHTSTASFKVASFNHAGISTGCAGCHDAKTATGKPAIHIPTQAPCENCHKSTAAFSTLVMDHTGIGSGCAACHGGQFGDVVAMPPTHLPTNAACESCHAPTKFTSFAGGTMNHAGIVAGCANCHAAGKTFFGVSVVTPPPTHLPFGGASCESCHSPSKFTNFGGTAMNHTAVAALGCAACHETGRSWFGVTIVTRPTPANDPNHPLSGECGTCHTSTSSFATGIVAGKPANHIPTNAACTLCHSNPANYKIYTMNHTGITGQCATCHASGLSFANIVPTSPPATHLPFGSAACENCHAPTKFTNFGGTTMNHAAVPGVACATCHAPGKTWYGVTVVTPPPTHVPFGGASCDSCHSPSKFTNFGGTAMNHAAVSSTSCATCHETGRTWYGVTIVTRPTPAQDPAHPIGGECGNCHSSTVSFATGVTGGKPANHIPTNQACTLCHSDSTNYKIFSMNHSGITGQCATCHGPGLTFANIVPVSPPSTHIPYAGAACESCHAPTKFTNFGGTAMNHAPVSGIACSTCHETGKSWYGVTIVTRPTAAQDPNHPTAGECSNCHTSTTSFAAGVSTLPANHIPTTQACTLCHNNPGGVMKPGVMNHQGITTNCTQCHLAAVTGKAFLGVTPVPQGSGHVPTSISCESCHAGFTSFAGGTMNHTGITSGCATCHASGKTFNGVNVVTPPATHIPFGGAACESCHAPTKFTNFGGTAMNHAPVAGIACSTCHETGKSWYGVTIVTRPTAAQDPNHPTAGECSNCHTSTTSFAAGVSTLPANHIPTTQACTLCHNNPGGVMKPGVMNHQGITTNCTQCHLAAVTGKAFLGVTPVPQGSGHVPTSISCESCHVGFTSFKGGTMNHVGITSGCATCHASGKTFNGVNVVTPPATHIPFGTAACEACHSPTKFSNFGNTPMNHTPVASLTCATCHASGKSWYGVTIVTLPATGHIPNPGNLDCKGCHTSTTSFASWKMNHSGISTGCVACHGGQFPGVKKKPSDHPQTNDLCENCHTVNTFDKALLLPAGKTAGSAPARTAAATLMPGSAGAGTTRSGTIAPADQHAGATPGGCITCHNGVRAIGKPARHVVTVAACDSCHRTISWLPVLGGAAMPTPLAAIVGGGVTVKPRGAAAVNPHIGIAPGTCVTCHNGSAAQAKPGRHVATALSCDACHRTTAWVPASFTHAGVAPTTCATCHNGSAASARPASHFVTTRSCDTCHRMTSWLPPIPYRHLSPAYSPHPSLDCLACHKGNSEMVVWRYPASKPDCAGCHVNVTVKPRVPHPTAAPQRPAN